MITMIDRMAGIVTHERVPPTINWRDPLRAAVRDYLSDAGMPVSDLVPDRDVPGMAPLYRAMRQRGYNEGLVDEAIISIRRGQSDHISPVRFFG
jgi:hypothetical protein